MNSSNLIIFFKKLPILYKFYIVLISFEQIIINCFSFNLYFPIFKIVFYNNLNKIEVSNFFYFLGLFILFIILKIDKEKKLDKEKILSFSISLILASFSTINLYTFENNKYINYFICGDYIDYSICDNSYNYEYNHFSKSKILFFIKFITDSIGTFHSISNIYSFFGIILLFYYFIKKDFLFYIKNKQKANYTKYIFDILKYSIFLILIYILKPISVSYELEYAISS